MSDIGGDWDGIYSYGGRQRDFPAMHFGATLTVADPAGGFAGAIMDAGVFGEAGVAGAVQGDAVRFVKTYHQSRPGWTSPVHYERALSADGQTAHGTWQIHRRLYGMLPLRLEGVWRMQRLGLPPMQAVWPPPPRVTE